LRAKNLFVFFAKPLRSLRETKKPLDQNHFHKYLDLTKPLEAFMHGFELKEKRFIPEINSNVMIYHHNKSGARLLHIDAGVHSEKSNHP